MKIEKPFEKAFEQVRYGASSFMNGAKEALVYYPESLQYSAGVADIYDISVLEKTGLSFIGRCHNGIRLLIGVRCLD